MSKPTSHSEEKQAIRTYSIPVYKVALVRDGRVKSESCPQVRDTAETVAIVRRFLEGVDREHFVVVLLNGKNRIIGINTVSVGSLTSSLAHPREIFKPAIIGNAAAIVLAHNHPSGEPTPSAEDIELTKRIREVGEIMGIRVLDHIVIGDGTGRWVSFVDEGLW
jgi:DNA repair protein RadC